MRDDVDSNRRGPRGWFLPYEQTEGHSRSFRSVDKFISDRRTDRGRNNRPLQDRETPGPQDPSYPKLSEYNFNINSFFDHRKSVTASSHCSKRRITSIERRNVDKPRRKKYLSSLPLLSKPKEGETLLVYLAVSEVAVSTVLVREEKGTQSPTYYVSKILSGAETRYLYLEKLALALVVAARKLRPYFQCHPIAAVTTFPLRNILHKPEISGILAKWIVQMSEFDIEYKPRTAIKSQVLADFIADFSPGLMPLASKEAIMVSEPTSGVWTLFTDRASNVKGSGLGIVLVTPSGETLRQAIRTVTLTNNEAEYEALITGLELAQGFDSKAINVKCDSQLVVNQGRKRGSSCVSKSGSLTEIQGPESGTIVQLMNSALDTKGYYKVNSTNLVWDWRNEIIDYLEHGKLPKDPKSSRALRTKVARYSFEKGKLCRKSFQGPLARCLGASEASYIMREIHERICGNHSGADALVLQLVQAGYYWPHMELDAKDFIRKYDECQRHAPMLYQPAEPLHSILSPWPFMK
uniref:RNase H type-1 domain-containing protein n=1 Tax=Nicotiana tabacum TaxID=4097 RepID=A0A1S4BG51_TOBAC|nr:PREDICTED: uncharacterized protein LOC107807903 [Nicotiana tabacum]